MNRTEANQRGEGHPMQTYTVVVARRGRLLHIDTAPGKDARAAALEASDPCTL